MPIFTLEKEIVFPPISLADESGILAVGGDLSVERLKVAYRSGIFPWYSEGEPIIWWSPNPRFVLFPDKLHISKSTKKLIKKNSYRITFDTEFERVIKKCKSQRDESGTWLNNEMIESYIELFNRGNAHSVEVWDGEELVGGLYGIAMGSLFFGESMFSIKKSASKVGFIILVNYLKNRGFSLIDCQVYTEYLESLGAENIKRETFTNILEKGLKEELKNEAWKNPYKDISCLFSGR